MTMGTIGVHEFITYTLAAPAVSERARRTVPPGDVP